MLADVGAGVLQAFDVEVAADIGLDRVGRDYCALECGVAPGGDAGDVAGRDVGVAARYCGDHGRGDGPGALLALQRCKPALGKVQALLCDGGYVGQPFVQGVQEILGGHVTVQIAKRSELHTFKVMPQRWVVERSFAWLEKNRRLWKNCERLLNTSLQFVHLAFLALLLRRL